MRAWCNAGTDAGGVPEAGSTPVTDRNRTGPAWPSPLFLFLATWLLIPRDSTFDIRYSLPSMRLWAYCLAAFVYDWFVFVYWIAVPVRAEGFGASSTQLALLQAASTVPYVLNSLFIGRVADRMSKARLARVGCLVAALACIWTAHAPGLALLFLGAPLLGIGASIFWPPVQGGIGAESDPARMERALGLFNVMWSLGKALGFATAGALLGQVGHAWVLWIAAASAVAILPLYPADLPAARPAAPHAGHEDRAVFRTLAYVGNFAAFGIGATLQNQIVKLFKSEVPLSFCGLETFLGLFLGTVFLAQTLVFALLRGNSRWTYRRSWLYAAQAVSIAALVAVSLLRQPLLLLAVAPLIGGGIGFTYASSIYYSLHGPSDHGRYAGIHEAVLGSGSFLIPLAGGIAADLSGDLRSPYWVAAAVCAVAMAAQELIYRRAP